MEGGFHYDKIGFMKKMMLKMVKKSIAKKENKTQQDIDMEKMLGSSVDNSSKDNISELVSYVKECS